MALVEPPGEVLAEERACWAHDAAVSEVMGVLNAASARLIALVRQCLDEGWWEDVGCRSPEHWVTARCGLSAARAARLVRTARRVHDFPLLESLGRQGLVTEDHLHVAAAHAHPSHDRDLAACAPSADVRQLRRVVRSLPVPDEITAVVVIDGDIEVATPEPAPLPDDVTFGWGDDGRLRGRFDVGGAAGAVIEQAFRAARNRVFAERTGVDADAVDGARLEEVRWADAFERLGHAGLAGLDPASAGGQRPGDRYQVLLHVDLDRPELSRLHLGPLLPSSVRRELTCDADVRAVLWRGGRPVGFGRRRRVADPMLRALIEDRDDGCRVCGRRGWLHIHHLVHWEDGGPTDDDNLAALCARCHRAVHAGRLRLVGDPTKPGGLLALDHHGRPLPRPSPLPVRALPESPAAYPGADRSGRWRVDPFLVPLDRDDGAVTYF